MSERMNTRFTPERILQLAQQNLTGMLLITIAYLKEHGLSLKDYFQYLGKHFAPKWRHGLTALEVAYYQARNHASFGQELYQLTGGDTDASIVMSAWPDDGTLAAYGISREDAETILHSLVTIVDHVGYDCRYYRQEDRIIATLSRRHEG